MHCPKPNMAMGHPHPHRLLQTVSPQLQKELILGVDQILLTFDTTIIPNQQSQPLPLQNQYQYPGGLPTPWAATSSSSQRITHARIFLLWRSGRANASTIRRHDGSFATGDKDMAPATSCNHHLPLDPFHQALLVYRRWPNLKWAVVSMPLINMVLENRTCGSGIPTTTTILLLCKLWSEPPPICTSTIWINTIICCSIFAAGLYGPSRQNASQQQSQARISSFFLPKHDAVTWCTTNRRNAKSRKLLPNNPHSNHGAAFMESSQLAVLVAAEVKLLREHQPPHNNIRPIHHIMGMLVPSLVAHLHRPYYSAMPSTYFKQTRATRTC